MTTTTPSTRRRPGTARAVLAAAVVTFLASATYYALLGDLYRSLSSAAPGAAPPHPGQILAQLARNLVEIGTLAVLMRWTRVTTWSGTVRLALLVWVGLQVVAVSGSVIHEDYPVGLFALHVGDALLTTLISCAILHGAFHFTRR